MLDINKTFNSITEHGISLGFQIHKGMKNKPRKPNRTTLSSRFYTMASDFSCLQLTRKTKSGEWHVTDLKEKCPKPLITLFWSCSNSIDISCPINLVHVWVGAKATDTGNLRRRTWKNNLAECTNRDPYQTN